jgi:plastocyanin
MKARHALLGASSLLVAVVGATAATATPTLPTRIPTVHIQASDFRFCPSSAPACTPADSGVTTVKRGTRVTWTYTDYACDAVVPCPGHNVVFANGRGARRLVKAQGATIYTAVFTRPGRYAYVCTAHSSFGMTGTVVVTR